MSPFICLAFCPKSINLYFFIAQWAENRGQGVLGTFFHWFGSNFHQTPNFWCWTQKKFKFYIFDISVSVSRLHITQKLKIGHFSTDFAQNLTRPLSFDAEHKTKFKYNIFDIFISVSRLYISQKWKISHFSADFA